MDPNTPVLVGVAAVQQKMQDYTRALEPIALMEEALRRAGADAGAPQLLEIAEEILVPKGIWEYSDPARLLAQALGADAAHTVLAEIGVSQQTVISRACERIANGEIQVALVAGAEAKWRSLCAAKAGAEVSEIEQKGIEPDLKLEPEAEMWSPVESATGLGMPVGFYAIMDSALRYKQGLTPDQHRDQMAAIYSRFSEVAAANADAWSDQALSPAQIRDESPGNRMLAFPYAKLHNSQWNVDQGAGLIFCSAGLAMQLGIDRSRWVFPRAFAEANEMSVVTSRGHLGGNPGFRLAGQAVARAAGVDLNKVELRELYSCFPYAVRVQLEEFGLAEGDDLTVTGGMTFGGGPLNNFVFQAVVKMSGLLREQPGELGLVTTVSAMLTKQGCALWSTEPNPGGWVFEDVTEAVKEISDIREVVADYTGEAVVAGYTVLYQGTDPWRAVAVFDLPKGQRTVAYSEEPGIIEPMLQKECCGESFTLQGGQFTSSD